MNIWELIMIKVRAAFNAHKTDSDAHHARYTDAEAAAAIAAVDAYVKKVGDTINGDITLNGELTLNQRRNDHGFSLYGYDWRDFIEFDIYIDYYGEVYLNGNGSHIHFTDQVTCHKGLDLGNYPIIHAQEHDDGTLSGDTKVFTFKDSTGVYYYVRGYRDKT